MKFSFQRNKSELTKKPTCLNATRITIMAELRYNYDTGTRTRRTCDV